jgi:EcsC protein family
MNPKQNEDLSRAVKLLENPSLGARIADVIGTPIEKAIALLPAKANEMIATAAHKAILGSVLLATRTMKDHTPGDVALAPESSDWWHIGAIALSGFGGGIFGLPALIVELPLSTTIIMRSIADVARSEGANLNQLETRLECIQVLALGGKNSSDDEADIGYFVAREALAKAVSNAAAHIANNGLAQEEAPALVRMIIKIAERYSITVTDKAAAQLMPIIGGLGGALINTIFISHFQDVARGHFTVKRLEREVGAKQVKERYAEICKSQGSKGA